MKRLFFVALALLLAVTALGISARPSQAQDAPAGTFFGTWPYKPLPDHNLNGFAANGPNDNLGVVFRQMVEMPAAFYMFATGEYMPMLAESWGFTEDNTAYELKINAEAMWSDGSPITADDVLATYAIGRIMGWTQFNYVATVEKVDDKTVRFVFSGDPSYLAERLILKEYIVAAATYADLAAKATALYDSGATNDSEEWTALRTEITEFRPEQLLASGPYTYTLDDVSDSYMTLRWQPNSLFSSTVNFGEIRLWAGETEATTPLVLDGSIAWSTNVYPATTQQAFLDAGLRMIATPRTYGPALLFNHAKAPWNIKEVRQAVALVINREENAFLTNGFGAIPTEYMAGILDPFVPQLLNQEDIDALDRYEYDTDRAAALLESVGFSKNDDGKWVDADGNVVTAEYTFPADFADFSAASQHAIEQLNSFGFDVSARALPWQESRDNVFAGTFDLSIWSWGSGTPFSASHFANPVRRFNYIGLGDGRPGMDFQMEFEYNGEQINLNDLITASSAGLDLEAQRAVAGQIAKIYNDLMIYIPLNVLVSIEPWNESLIAGAPEDGDPILQNPSTDHFVLWYLLNGMLSPAS